MDVGFSRPRLCSARRITYEYCMQCAINTVCVRHGLVLNGVFLGLATPHFCFPPQAQASDTSPTARPTYITVTPNLLLTRHHAMVFGSAGEHVLQAAGCAD